MDRHRECRPGPAVAGRWQQLVGHRTAMRRPKSRGRHHVREYRRVSTHRACAASDWDNRPQLPKQRRLQPPNAPHRRRPRPLHPTLIGEEPLWLTWPLMTGAWDLEATGPSGVFTAQYKAPILAGHNAAEHGGRGAVLRCERCTPRTSWSRARQRRCVNPVQAAAPPCTVVKDSAPLHLSVRTPS